MTDDWKQFLSATPPRSLGILRNHFASRRSRILDDMAVETDEITIRRQQGRAIQLKELIKDINSILEAEGAN